MILIRLKNTKKFDIITLILISVIQFNLYIYDDYDDGDDDDNNYDNNNNNNNNSDTHLFST